MTDVDNMELLAGIYKIALSVARAFFLTHLLFY